MSNRVTTTTNTVLMPKLVDTILNSNVFATRVLTDSKQWPSSEKIKQPIKVSKSDTGGSFSGFDTFDRNAVDTRINLEFEAKFYQQGVTLPLTEIWKNRADTNRILDLMAVEVSSAAEDMADDIGTLFFSDGTGNNSKDFLGLEAIVDDGNEVGTYGTQSRSTYTTLQATNTASGGTLTLDKMATLYTDVASGSVKPTMAICDESVWNLYEQLLQPQERIYKTISQMKNGANLAGGTGFMSLEYKGMPVVADEKATAQTLYFLNEDYLQFSAMEANQGTKPIDFRLVDIEGNDYTNVMGLGFSWSGWKESYNQAALSGDIYLGGELWSENPKRHGKLEGVTSV